MLRLYLRAAAAIAAGTLLFVLMARWVFVSPADEVSLLIPKTWSRFAP